MNRPSVARSLRAVLVTAMLASGASTASAAVYSWLPKSETGDWTTSTNWSGTSGSLLYPGSTTNTDTARLQGDLTAAMTVNLDQSVSVQQINIGDNLLTGTTWYPTTLSTSNGSSLTFAHTTATGTAVLALEGGSNPGEEIRITPNIILSASTWETRNPNVASGVSNLGITGNVTGGAGSKTIRYTPAGATVSSSYLDFRGTITDGSGTVGILYRNDMPTSTNALKLTGTGNSFSGPVTVTRGTLEASPVSGTSGALGTGLLTLGSSTNTATLNLGGSLSTVTERNGINIPVGTSNTRRIAVTGAGDRILSGTMNVLYGVTLACSNSGNLTFSNAISGTSPITISSTGSGKVIFGGNSTHTGTTTVTQGWLQLDGSLDAASSLSVAAAGSFGGSGTANGAAAISGTLSPGSTTGVLTLGSLVLASPSMSLIELPAAGARGTDYDGVSILSASGLAYGGTMSLAFGGSKLGSTTFDVFSFTGATSGSFATIASTGYYAGTWTNNNDGTYSFAKDEQTLTFTQSTGDVSIIPEPAALSAAALGIAASMALWRRKNHRVSPGRVRRDDLLGRWLRPGAPATMD